MIDLSGKSVVVTGGSSGMGRATAVMASHAGASVTIGDVDLDRGNEVVREIVAHGGRAHFIRTNVSREEDVKALIKGAIGTFGGLDGAFNNAAISGAAKPLHEITLEEFTRTQQVNFQSIFLCMKYEILAMRERGGGSIVNNSAAGSVIGIPNISDYASSKSGVNGLTRSAAVEYARDGIRVNCIYPGTIDTPMSRKALANAPGFEEALLEKQPIGRLGLPEDVAPAVIFLLSDLSSFMTGAFVPVDGGFTV
jgi:2,5-dichloro-2,5-cyclohexadiene-1,4-diol dehydrogenase 1